MYRWVILSLFVTSQLLLSIGISWGPLAPFVKKTLLLTDAQWGAVGFALYLATAISSFPSGISVDRYGVRRNFLLWLGITGVPLLLISLIHPSYLLLIILITISGLGYGMGNQVATKGLFGWFDARTRGTALGIRQAAVPGGFALAGVFLVYVAQRSSWHMAVGIIGALLILMLGISFFLYKEAPSASSPRGKKGKGEGIGLKEILSNRKLLILFIAGLLFGIGQGVITTFLVLYLTESLKYTEQLAGGLYAFSMIGAGVGRIFWGLVSDRIFNGRRAPVLLIMAILAILTVMVTLFWPEDWSAWLFSIPAFFLGFLGLGYNAVFLMLSAELGDPSRTGTVIGVGSLIGWVGVAIGPLVFGNIVTFSGYSNAWFFVAAAYFVAMLLCASLTFPVRWR